MAEIKPIRFIDAVMAALIIFTLAAPLVATGVAKVPQIEHKPISIAVDDNGSVYVTQPVQVNLLADRLKEIATAGAGERIYVRGANQVSRERIAEVMSVITAAGYRKVTLVTDPDNN
jgi:biopolymer transport protein TolR